MSDTFVVKDEGDLGELYSRVLRAVERSEDVLEIEIAATRLEGGKPGVPAGLVLTHPDQPGAPDLELTIRGADPQTELVGISLQAAARKLHVSRLTFVGTSEPALILGAHELKLADVQMLRPTRGGRRMPTMDLLAATGNASITVERCVVESPTDGGAAIRVGEMAGGWCGRLEMRETRTSGAAVVLERVGLTVIEGCDFSA